MMLVRWELPPVGWIKLNTDGAFTHHTNLAGIGGIIRNNEGKILEGFSAAVTADSSYEAELKAIEFGMEVAKGISQHVWVEVDAQVAVRTLVRQDRGPSKYRHVMAKIRTNMSMGNWKISHIQREGNRIADWLAKQGINQATPQGFQQESAPPLVKILAYLDQTGLPNLREITEGIT